MAKVKKSVMEDLMDEVEAPKPEAPKKGKKDKPVIHCTTPQDQAVLDNYASSDAIFKVAKSSAEDAKAKAKEVFRQRFIQMCAQRGSRPENPRIVAPNSSANFVCKHIPKMARSGTTGEVINAADQLKAMGFSNEIIEQVEEKVINEKVSFGLKAFTDLTAEDMPPEYHKLADKLMTLVKKQFTASERKILLQKTIVTTVDEGWPQLAVALAGESVPKDAEDREAKVAAALDKLFTVLPQTWYLTHGSFTGELSKAASMLIEANVKEQAEADKKPPKIINSANGKYRAEVRGKKVTLFIVKPDGDEEVGTKPCENQGHAEATARKWFSAPDYLAEFITNCKTGGK